MRVVAGELRGRRIDAPDGDSTRPTTDKVREAVFNALGSLGAVDDALAVDLFAGSGALGIEALSRGASRCVFVENDRRALEVLRGNLESLGLGGQSAVVVVDLVRESSVGGSLRLRELLADATLVLADPPYGFSNWGEIFSAAESAAKDVVLVIETEARAAVHRDVPAGWKAFRTRDYGRTTVGFFTREEMKDGGS
ncbi:MAG: 16S rRNA (guanine(966)-N(2))-methyltransferase RsmD [Acidobacteria bacterium]|nr:16S rRNA (guanine(966)-N(2))-methyltransferase RsmD [Acidobacteriota bacterium]